MCRAQHSRLRECSSKVRARISMSTVLAAVVLPATRCPSMAGGVRVQWMHGAACTSQFNGHKTGTVRWRWSTKRPSRGVPAVHMRASEVCASRARTLSASGGPQATRHHPPTVFDVSEQRCARTITQQMDRNRLLASVQLTDPPGRMRR